MKRLKVIKNRLFYIDYRLLIPVITLLFIGILAIMDVSAPKAMDVFSDRFYFAKQQLKWIILGLGVYLIFSQINVFLWEKYAFYLYLLSFIFLIIVLIPGVGVETLGARRWINLGFFNFQPSEFAKLAMCIYMAKLSLLKKNLPAFILPIILVSALIMLQPDLGTTLVIIFTSMVQLIFSGVKLKQFLLIVTAGLFLVTLLIFSSDYRRSRVTSFLNPIGGESSDGNYHIRQVLYSLAIGGFGGTGIGQSKQKYLFLPEATTDSIFAIIAEETGFLGVFVIILIYGFISFRMIRLIKTMTNSFLVVLASGIFSWFIGQTFINLGSISSLIPFTGVPLPFISYGGSTLITLLVAFGIFNSAVKYSNTDS